MADLTPDDITQQRFNTSFRGFDPVEVRGYLETLAGAVGQLVEERDRMAAKLSELGERDLRSEFESIGREVSAVLEAAREAADQLRQRASNDATRWRSEAVAEAEAELRRARADAEQLRGDAWSTADEMLKQAVSEADRIEATSEKERLRLVGEAEREAHRVVAVARRESEDLIRNAKVEADRLTVNAQTAHDQLIERATRQAEAAQERTRALEIRRQELKAELDAIRHALATAEGELEERRSALQLSPQSDGPEPTPPPRPADSDEKPLPSDEWTPGETVRVVRPGGVAPDTRTTVGAINETPEIVVLSPEEVKARRQADEEGPDEADLDEPSPARAAEIEAIEIEPAQIKATDIEAAEPEATSDEDADEPAAVDEVTGPPETEPAMPEESGPGPDLESPSDPADRVERTEAEPESEPIEGVTVREPESVETQEPEFGMDEGADVREEDEPDEDSGRFEELSGLFARLREPSKPPALAAAEPEATEQPHQAEQPATVEQPKRRTPAWGGDPFELRARLLLPVSNRALRNIKRQLTEAQNEALEELRLADGKWDPDGPSLGARLRPDLVVLSAESFASGHAAAMEMSGERFKRPSTPKTEPEIEWVTALLGDLNHALAEGRKQGQGARELGASVSRVFRAWRTDEAERRVSELASARYHVGLSEVLLDNGFSTAWVIAGRGCTTCRSRAESVPSEWETQPPAHANCDCTLELV